MPGRRCPPLLPRYHRGTRGAWLPAASAAFGRARKAGALARWSQRRRSRRRGARGPGLARTDAVSVTVGAGGAPVLITGGAGFIGTNLADRLLRHGRRVRIYDNLARSGAEENLDWLMRQHRGKLDVEIGDIRDADR